MNLVLLVTVATVAQSQTPVRVETLVNHVQLIPMMNVSQVFVILKDGVPLGS